MCGAPDHKHSKLRYHLYRQTSFDGQRRWSDKRFHE